MSTSRYSSKAHQRDRQALFSMEDLTKSQSPSPTPVPLYENTDMNFSINSMDNSNKASVGLSDPYERSKLPSYSAKAHELSQLEAQSDETMDIMKDKIGALRDLSLAMGDQINKSKRGLAELGEDMGISSDRIKWNMGRMRRFVEKSGVGWKVWLGFATIVVWWFLWVWLF